MKIKNVILLVISFAFGSYIFVDLVFNHNIAYQEYLEVDKNEAIHRMETAHKAIKREIHYLDNLTHNWAAWDDSYFFIDNLNSSYIDSNLIDTTFTDNEINSIYYFDRDAQKVWGKTIDLKNKQIINISTFANTTFPDNHPLFLHNGPASSISGIVLTDKGPLLLSSRPIVTSNGEGPIKGTLIMAKLLDSNLLETISKQTDISFEFWTVSPDKGHFHLGDRCPDISCAFEIDEPKMIPELDVLKEISILDYIILRKKANDTIHAYTYVKDLITDSGLLFRTKVPMETTAITRQVLSNAFITNILAGLIVLIIVLQIINMVIVRPINLLISHAEKIRASGSSEIKISSSLQTDNELGKLGLEIDSMMERLADAQRQLVDQSYFSGMNEVASGVMHNIRNAMNPIIADIDMIREELAVFPLKDLRKARKELHLCTAPDRKKKLSIFIDNGLEHFDLLVSDATDRLQKMTDRINTVEMILIEQEKFARSGVTSENVDLQEIISSSMKFLNRDKFTNIEINIDSTVQQIGNVFGDKNAIMHIMTNFLNNSSEAISKAGRKDGKITVRAEPEKRDNSLFAHITVKDNGIGIKSENIGKIYHRGFSTKDRATSGVGLHWCANTVAALDGTIYVESDGRSGTIVHLILPKKNNNLT